MHVRMRLTTHYSQAELTNLIAAAEKVCESESRKPPQPPGCVVAALR
jgi:hypothetical protein